MREDGEEVSLVNASLVDTCCLVSNSLANEAVLPRYGVCGRGGRVLLRHQRHYSQRHHSAHLQAPIRRSPLLRKFVWHRGKKSMCRVKHYMIGSREKLLEGNVTTELSLGA